MTTTRGKFINSACVACGVRVPALSATYKVHAYTASDYRVTSGPFATAQNADEFAIAIVGTPYSSAGAPCDHIVRCEIEVAAEVLCTSCGSRWRVVE